MIALRVDLSWALGRLLGQPDALLARAGRLAVLRAAEGYVDDIHEWIRSGRSYTPGPPRDGMTIEQGIGWRPEGQGAVIYSQAPHGRYVEEGTRPHLIRPRPGRKALRWYPAGGGIMMRRVVRHPGTDPEPFFVADTLRRQTRMIEASVEAVAEVLGA